MSAVPQRSDLLWALAFPTGLLLTMGVLLLHFQIYPAARLESLALLAVLATIGAATGVVMYRGGRVMRAIVVGILVTIFLNHVVEWSAVGIRSRYHVPGSFLIGFALSWLLGRNLHVIGAAGGVAMLLATLAMPAESPLSRISSAAAKTALPGAPPPPVLHLILDGHQGVETFPADVPGSEEMKGELRAFYAEQGFRLYGGAFSRSSWTWNSLPDLLNFGVAQRDGELIRYGRGLEWTLQRSEYFRRMVDFGYRVHVYQTDILDFCTHDVTTCTTVRFRSLNWIEQAGIPVRDKFYLLATTFLDRSSIWTGLAGLYNKGAGMLAARTAIRLSPLAAGSSGRLPYTPLSVRALAQLLVDDMPRFGPGDLVLAHLMIPHHPYALDAQCQLRGGPGTWYGPTKQEHYRLYLEQMGCTNRIVGELLAASSPAAHIVVHGDHGARVFDTNDDQFGTLFAVRRPDQPADYVRTRTAIDELLVRELLQPIGVPAPSLTVSGTTIKRIVEPQGPLRFEAYENPVSTASGN